MTGGLIGLLTERWRNVADESHYFVDFRDRATPCIANCLHAVLTIVHTRNYA